MSPRYIGVNPNEVVWKSLKFPWWQRVIRRIAVLGFITALIVFWAIPVAFVGLISNIQYLMTYTWLAWLDKIPTVIMGVISGLLPSVMLAILMSLVPIIMRRKFSLLSPTGSSGLSEETPCATRVSANVTQPSRDFRCGARCSVQKALETLWELSLKATIPDR